jgi:hypothetical protein
MIELLSKHCKKIVTDPIFLHLIQGHIDNITRDHRFTKADIPSLVLLILELTNNLDKLHLTREQAQEALPDIVMYILTQFDIIKGHEADYRDIINVACSLATLIPKVKKFKCF